MSQVIGGKTSETTLVETNFGVCYAQSEMLSSYRFRTSVNWTMERGLKLLDSLH